MGNWGIHKSSREHRRGGGFQKVHERQDEGRVVVAGRRGPKNWHTQNVKYWNLYVRILNILIKN